MTTRPKLVGLLPGEKALATQFMSDIISVVSLKRCVMTYVRRRVTINGVRTTQKLVKSARIYLSSGSRIFLYNPPEYWGGKRGR